MKATTIAKIWFVLALMLMPAAVFRLLEPVVMDPQDVERLPAALEALIYVQFVLGILLLIAAVRSVRAERVLTSLLAVAVCVSAYSIMACGIVMSFVPLPPILQNTLWERVWLVAMLQPVTICLVLTLMTFMVRKRIQRT